MVFEIGQTKEGDPQSWNVVGHMRIAGAAPATYDRSARRQVDLLPEIRYETLVLASGLTKEAASARLEEELAAKVREQEEAMARYRAAEPEGYGRAYAGMTAAAIFADEQAEERKMYEQWLADGAGSSS